MCQSAELGRMVPSICWQQLVSAQLCSSEEWRAELSQQLHGAQLRQSWWIVLISISINNLDKEVGLCSFLPVCPYMESYVTCLPMILLTLVEQWLNYSSSNKEVKFVTLLPVNARSGDVLQSASIHISEDVLRPAVWRPVWRSTGDVLQSDKHPQMNAHLMNKNAN